MMRFVPQRPWLKNLVRTGPLCPLNAKRRCVCLRSAVTLVTQYALRTETPEVTHSKESSSINVDAQIRGSVKRRCPPTLVHKGMTVCKTDPVWQNAAILIDKAREWTSFDICAKMRGMLRMRKIGHAGTLDPNATGLLIVCTGQGTKSIESFVAQQKEYTGRLRLGEATASYDAETEVSRSAPWQHINDEDLKAAEMHFQGEMMQLPPMYSAIKIKGEALYKAARRGLEVERSPRPVTIHSLRLARSVDDHQSLEYVLSCSKGTYVRSLVHDLGKFWGSLAHVTSLRRTKIGEHSVENAWSVEELNSALNSQESDSAAQIHIKDV